MIKIILKKKEKKKLIILINKHKIKEIIGIFDNKNLLMDTKKLQYCIKNGYSFSKSAFDLIYKKLTNTELIYPKDIIL